MVFHETLYIIHALERHVPHAVGLPVVSLPAFVQQLICGSGLVNELKFPRLCT